MRLLLPSLFALLLACGSCPGGGKKEASATLLFTSDIWGQLEPCGCSADMKGGLDRMAGYVQVQRAKGPVLLVDTGDALFDSLAYRPDEEVQAKIRAGAVADALLAMGLDAKALHERDRVLEGAADAFPSQVVLKGLSLHEVGGVKVGLLPLGTSPTAEEAREGAAGLRASGADLVVALVHVRRSEAASLQLPGVDLAVGGHIESVPEGDEAVEIQGNPPILFPAARGQGLLQVEVVRRAPGEPFQIVGTEQQRDAELAAIDDRIRSYHQRIQALPEDTNPGPFLEKVEELKERREALATTPLELPEEGNSLAHRFIPITQELPQAAGVQAILRAYDQEVGEANLAYAKANPRPCPEPAPGEASFVGQATCAACHQEAQAFWETTDHAKAYETLVEVHKQYDLSCISCHVIGWERPGGPCSVADVEGRKDVGCESCHGPGSLHVAAPSRDNIQVQVPEATCVSCHTPEQSLDFDYASYLRRILGPGHGQPETP